MTILSTLKSKLANTLFKNEFALIEKMVENLNKREESLSVKENVLFEDEEDFKTKVKNPAYWIEHITKQYNPIPDLLSDYGGDVLSMVIDMPAFNMDQEDFLSQIADISKNEAFNVLIKCLMQEQIRYCGMQDVAHADQFNYARATLNGFLIIDKEIRDIALTYKNNQEAKNEEFDEHAIT